MRLIFILLPIFMSVTVTATAEVWRGRGVGAEFTLKHDRNGLSFIGKVEQGEIPERTCNRQLLQNFMTRLRRELQNPANFLPGRSVQLSIDGDQVAPVNAQGPLGILLRSLDDSYHRLVLAERLACGGSKATR